MCPFCSGREKQTPPEVMAVRTGDTQPDGPGWKVRVVPNKYPAFGPADGVLEESGHGHFHHTMNAIGVHEVLVSSPNHQHDLGDLPLSQVRYVVDTMVERYKANKTLSCVEYLLLIHNHGRDAGASLEHPHSQLFGFPLVPSAVADEIEGMARYRSEWGKCAFCHMIEIEQADAIRMVFENDGFATFAPFASSVPFETWIVPKHHSARFEEMTEINRAEFAEALKDLTSRISRGLNDPPFNFYIHTGPTKAAPALDYHWHLELVPKLTIAAGFELGSHISINVRAPEDAAEFLRSSLSGPDTGKSASPGCAQ
jgi:UDPglucose--hexose-1-phosphate uridylyltransferase